MSEKNTIKLTINQGFTLIELMVVLVIIGILLTLTTLAISSHDADRELQIEAQRLSYLLQLAHEQAILQGFEMGLEVLPDGYRFYQQQAGEWLLLRQDDTFFPRQLPPGTTFELVLETRPILLGDNKALPQLLLLSSGELIPFQLKLGLADSLQSLWMIEGNLIGQINLKRVTDASF